jgi:hypothetical protein
MFNNSLVRTGHPGGLEQDPLRRRNRAETWCLHRLRQLPFPSWQPMHLQKQEPLGSGCLASVACSACCILHTHNSVRSRPLNSPLTLGWNFEVARQRMGVCSINPDSARLSTIQKRWFAVPKESSALHLTGFAFYIAKPTRRESDYQTWTARSSGSALCPARLPPVELLQV